MSSSSASFLLESTIPFRLRSNHIFDRALPGSRCRRIQIQATENVPRGGTTMSKGDIVMVNPLEAKRLADLQMQEIQAKNKLRQDIVTRLPNVHGRIRCNLRETSHSANIQTTTCSPSGRSDELAPLVNALRTCSEQDVACFHFPGHNRGKGAPASLSQLIGVAPYKHDLPELPELDNLFSPNGVIFESQRLASELFGSSKTWFLVGGTTCGIQASVMATCSPGDTLILPRNCHLSSISAMVLTGAVPKYIFPEYNSKWDIAAGITSTQVEEAINDLKKVGKRAGAVLVVSPTYHGVCSNINEIAKVCHRHDVPLIVDEAHGAHFKFHPQLPDSALEQGADLAVQSTHKVLGSLTQSSMLHMSGNLVNEERISSCLQLLESSSPSYLLLASLDAARAQLSSNPESIFDETISLATTAMEQLMVMPGISVLNKSSFFPEFSVIDPLRITVGFWKLGMTGYEADDILDREQRIIAELVGSHHITFALNLGTHKEEIQRLISGIRHLSATSFQGLQQQKENKLWSPFMDIEMRQAPREAFFTKKMKVDVDRSIGEICGELICPYPPGIPVLIPGEIVTQSGVSYLLDAKKNGAMISGAADPELGSIIVCSK